MIFLYKNMLAHNDFSFSHHLESGIIFYWWTVFLESHRAQSEHTLRPMAEAISTSMYIEYEWSTFGEQKF